MMTNLLVYLVNGFRWWLAKGTHHRNKEISLVHYVDV